MENMPQTDDEWRDKLTSEQFAVLRQGGTERAFAGILNDNHEPDCVEEVAVTRGLTA